MPSAISGTRGSVSHRVLAFYCSWVSGNQCVVEMLLMQLLNRTLARRVHAGDSCATTAIAFATLRRPLNAHESTAWHTPSHNAHPKRYHGCRLMPMHTVVLRLGARRATAH